MRFLPQPCRAAPVLRLVPVLLAGAGCASGDRVPLHPVRGKVPHTGKPGKGPLVVFHPLGQPGGHLPKPPASTDADGRFSLTTERPADGAPAGAYAVTVEQRERTAAGREQYKARNLLPA